MMSELLRQGSAGGRHRRKIRLRKQERLSDWLFQCRILHPYYNRFIQLVRRVPAAEVFWNDMAAAERKLRVQNAAELAKNLDSKLLLWYTNNKVFTMFA